MFKKDPIKKLRKAIEAKHKEAMEAQRSGDINRFAELTKGRSGWPRRPAERTIGLVDPQVPRNLKIKLLKKPPCGKIITGAL